MIMIITDDNSYDNNHNDNENDNDNDVDNDKNNCYCKLPWYMYNHIFLHLDPI